MKYFQFVLTNDVADKLDDIIKKSGKSKQKFFENLAQKIIKGEIKVE